jgi:hypothetical protein
MAGNEIKSEVRTGVFTGKKKSSKTANKWDFFFNEGGEEDRKYSSFEPLHNLTELVEGNEYRYTVEHKPTGKTGDNGQPTFYHNIGRKARDGPYVIEALGPIESEPIAPPKGATQPQTGASSPQKAASPPQTGESQGRQAKSLHDAVKDAREDYYRNKDAREAERERVYHLSLPYINAIQISEGVLAFMGEQSLNPKSEVSKSLDKEGFDKTFELLLRQAEGVVGTRLPKEAKHGYKEEKPAPPAKEEKKEEEDDGQA